MIQSLSLTSPTIAKIAASFGLGLLLSIIAIGAPNFSASFDVLTTPPWSGDTHTTFSKFKSLKYL